MSFFKGLLLFLALLVYGQSTQDLLARGVGSELARILQNDTVTLNSEKPTPLDAPIIQFPPSNFRLFPLVANAAFNLDGSMPEGKQFCLLNYSTLNSLIVYPPTGFSFGTFAVNTPLTIPAKNGFCFVRNGLNFVPVNRSVLDFDYTVNVTITNWTEDANINLTQNASAKNIRFVNNNTGIEFANTNPFVQFANALIFRTGTQSLWRFAITGDIVQETQGNNIVFANDNTGIQQNANNLRLASTSNINFVTNNAIKWQINSTGNLVQDASAGDDIVFNRAGTGVRHTGDLLLSAGSTNEVILRAGTTQVLRANTNNVVAEKPLTFNFAGTHISQDDLTINSPTTTAGISIRTANTERLNINASRIFASVPFRASTFENNSTLTIRTTTTSAINLQTNSTTRWTITSTGELQSVGTGADLVFTVANTRIRYSPTTGTFTIGTTGAVPLRLMTNNTEYIELTSGGVLQGINGGSINASSNVSFENVTWNGTTQQTIGTTNTTNPQSVRFVTGNTERLLLTTAGDLQFQSGGGNLVFTTASQELRNTGSALVLNSTAATPGVNIQTNSTTRLAITNTDATFSVGVFAPSYQRANAALTVGTTTSHNLLLQTNNTTRLTLTTSAAQFSVPIEATTLQNASNITINRSGTGGQIALQTNSTNRFVVSDTETQIRTTNLTFGQTTAINLASPPSALTFKNGSIDILAFITNPTRISLFAPFHTNATGIGTVQPGFMAMAKPHSNYPFPNSGNATNSTPANFSEIQVNVATSPVNCSTVATYQNMADRATTGFVTIRGAIPNNYYVAYFFDPVGLSATLFGEKVFTVNFCHNNNNTAIFGGTLTHQIVFKRGSGITYLSAADYNSFKHYEVSSGTYGHLQISISYSSSAPSELARAWICVPFTFVTDSTGITHIYGDGRGVSGSYISITGISLLSC